MPSATVGRPGAVHTIRHLLRPFGALKFEDMARVLEKTLEEWSNDKVPRLGASLAFYTLLSLAPLLVVTIGVAALVFGHEAAEGHLVQEIQGLVGPEGAKTIQAVIQGAYKPGTGVIATVAGILTLAVGGSSVVVELRDALNTIWHVPPKPECTRLAGILRSVKERSYSAGLVLGIGFLLLISLALNALISAMGKFFGAFLPTPEITLQAGTFLISFLSITFLFGAIYKTLPDVHLRWRDVIVGASATSLLFTIGKQLIGLYLGKTTLGSAYGAAGSLVIVLLWVYYSAQVFFLGAEFTKVHTEILRSPTPKATGRQN